jgi:uncharacterized protein (TIGR00251 family)
MLPSTVYLKDGGMAARILHPNACSKEKKLIGDRDRFSEFFSPFQFRFRFLSLRGIFMVTSIRRGGEVLLLVKVVPGAAHPRVVPMGERLKVCVVAPAEKGKANRAMLKAVGEWFGVPARLHSGASSPFKTVALSSTMEAVRARLEEK